MARTTAPLLGILSSVLIGLMAAGTLSAQDQGWWWRPDGMVGYERDPTNRVGTGDTLRIQRMAINLSDSILPAPFQPCGLRIETTAELRLLGERCSPALDVLFPGDSILEEKRWQVLAEPGKYDFLIVRDDETLRFSHVLEVSDAPDGEMDPPEPKRLPVVLHVKGIPESLPLTEMDFEGGIRSILWDAGFVPMIATETAARAMVGTTPYLLLEIDLKESAAPQLERRGRGLILDFEVSLCWLRDAGEPAAHGCPFDWWSGSGTLIDFVLHFAPSLERRLSDSSPITLSQSSRRIQRG